MPFSRSRSIESMTRSSTCLIGPEGARLPQQLIHERGLPVVDVSDDGDIADMFHSKKGREYGRSIGIRQWAFARRGIRLRVRGSGTAFFIDSCAKRKISNKQMNGELGLRSAAGLI